MSIFIFHSIYRIIYTYTIQNPPPNTTITWSSSNNSMTLISGQGTPNAVFQQTGFTNGEIRAEITPFTILRLPVTICQPSLSGSSAVCNQATYTIQNLPAGATVQWSVSNSNLQLVSAQGNTAVFRKNGNGYCTINCNVQINNQSIPLEPLRVYAGTPVTPVIIGETVLECNNSALYTTQDGRVVTWSVQGPFRIIGSNSGNKCIVRGTRSGIGWIYATVSNDCGISRGEVLVTVNCNGFNVSPNPATDVVTVQLQEETAGTVPEIATNSTPSRKTFPPGEYEIQLWSAAALIRSYKTDLPIYTVPVSDLPRGMYFIRVIKNGKTYTQKLLKN